VTAGDRMGRAGGISRLLVAALVAMAALVLTASPAVAHSRASLATNFDSRILSSPPRPGVEWRTYAGGDVIEVTNRTDRELLVLGYQGEPYLLVGPDGVFENRNSPTTYLNADRYADVAVPPRADPSADPTWARVSAGATVSWHDHRAHWMLPQVPQSVRAAPRTAQRIESWSIPILYDGHHLAIDGELWWVPGPQPYPWLLLSALVTAPILWGLRARAEGVTHLVRPAALGVAAIAMVNTIHYLDELVAWPAAALDILFGLLHTTLFVGTGLVGAAIAWRGRHGPLLSLGIASGAVLFHQGLLQLPTLTMSQLPTVWPSDLLRVVVALSLTQALWVGAVIVVGLRADARARRPTPPSKIAAPGRPPTRHLEPTPRRNP
jgi:hypothetical protein